MITPQYGTVLVVEDDPQLRSDMRNVFLAEGFSVLEASGGNEAFDLVNSSQVDIVVTDIRMPLGDGMALLRRIKSQNVERPVVVLVSAFIDLSSEIAFNNGAEGLLAKPTEIGLLLDTAHRAMTPLEQKWKQIVPEVPADHKIKQQVAEITLCKTGSLVIGRGGAFLAMEDGYPQIGALVEFEVTAARGDTDPFCGFGLVRWLRPYRQSGMLPGIGIEFICLSGPSRRLVNELVANSDRTPFIPQWGYVLHR